MSFKKETEKIVITSERLDTHYCQVQDWKIFTYFYQPPVKLLRGAPPLHSVIEHQVLCSNKRTNWKFIFPWRKVNWYVFQIGKALFSYSICLMISDKSIMLYYDVHVSSSCCCKYVPRASANKAYKKFVYKSFQFF